MRENNLTSESTTIPESDNPPVEQVIKRIRFIRDVVGCYNERYPKGSERDYRPWPFEWRGMQEPERVAKGIFVYCYGMGEFDAFTKEDVEPVFDKRNA